MTGIIPWYVDRWLGGTRVLSLEERGAFADWISAYAARDALFPDDITLFAQVWGCNTQKARRLRGARRSWIDENGTAKAELPARSFCLSARTSLDLEDGPHRLRLQQSPPPQGLQESQDIAGRAGHASPARRKGLPIQEANGREGHGSVEEIHVIVVGQTARLGPPGAALRQL